MKNKRTKRISPALKSVYPILILVVCLIMGIGYATLNTISLQITGQSVALLQKGVFITEANYSSSNGIDIVQSNINATSGTVLNSTITLSSSNSASYVTYTITILNNYNYKVYFEGTSFSDDFYDNTNIVFELSDNLVEGMMLDPHSYITFDITFKYKSGVSPNQSNCTLNSYISFDFKAVPVLKSTSLSDTTAFRSDVYKTKIKNITFQNKINVPSNAIESWDIGVSQTRDVMAYVVNNATAGYYDLYIQSNTQLYANEDMSDWFRGLKQCEKINGIEYLDTSFTTNMQHIFTHFGSSASTVVLDVSSFNTSKVTNMRSMFNNVGFESTSVTIELGNIDSSSVITMEDMFYKTATKDKNFSIDVSNLNTSKVTNMSNMFCETGNANKSFQLDVSNFDTSNVINFSYMFYKTGQLSTAFTLDVSGFDTSKATDMSGMFYYTGHQSLVLHLDVSNFDTSNVTNMNSMFKWAGHENPTFHLDVSNFNTSKVTDMAEMFRANGIRNPNFTIDVSNFDTSNVTDMKWMFYFVGNLSTELILDLGNWDTSKVTNMDSMFHSAGVKTIYASNKWSVSSVTSSASIFTSCNNLVGGMGTAYTSSYGDITYAKIDGGSSSPGYFTLRPEGYRMLNYIESNGQQYIDTGYIPTTDNYKVDMTYILTNTKSDQSLFGHESNYSQEHTSGRQWSIVSYRSGDLRQSHWVGTTEHFHLVDTVVGTRYRYIMHANNGTLTVTNNGETGSSSYNGPLLKIHNVFIFANNRDGAASQYSHMKLFAFKMYDNGTLVRDFVPCKNASGEAGLYDRVTKKFYGNKGISTFITG